MYVGVCCAYWIVHMQHADRVLIKKAAVYVYVLIATSQSSLYSDHAWLYCSLAKPLITKKEAHWLLEVLVVQSPSQ